MPSLREEWGWPGGCRWSCRERVPAKVRRTCGWSVWVLSKGAGAHLGHRVAHKHVLWVPRSVRVNWERWGQRRRPKAPASHSADSPQRLPRASGRVRAWGAGRRDSGLPARLRCCASAGTPGWPRTPGPWSFLWLRISRGKSGYWADLQRRVRASGDAPCMGIWGPPLTPTAGRAGTD